MTLAAGADTPPSTARWHQKQCLSLDPADAFLPGGRKAGSDRRLALLAIAQRLHRELHRLVAQHDGVKSTILPMLIAGHLPREKLV